LPAGRFPTRGERSKSFAVPMYCPVEPEDDPAKLDRAAMRGIVIFAIMFAIGAVIDAAFFKGRYLNDAQTAITGLTGLSTQIGKK
jgi:hypothetical protein